jgi:hypothetical protein
MAVQDPVGSAITIEHSADEPIVFYGPPAALRASIRLRNGSAEKARLSSLTVDAKGLRGPARQSPIVVSLRARLYPQEQAQVGALLAVDPSTPPGQYEGTVGADQRRYPVRVHVVPHVDFRLRPHELFIFADGPKRDFEREFIAENAGNVPVELDAECLVPLRDVAEARAALQKGLKDLNQDAKGADDDDVLRAVLRAWSDRQVGPLSIRRDRVTIEPGSIRPLSVTFHLPDNIQPSRRYVSELRVYTAPLHVEVITSLGSKRAAS